MLCTRLCIQSLQSSQHACCTSCLHFYFCMTTAGFTMARTVPTAGFTVRAVAIATYGIYCLAA